MTESAIGVKANSQPEIWHIIWDQPSWFMQALVASAFGIDLCKHNQKSATTFGVNLLG